MYVQGVSSNIWSDVWNSATVAHGWKGNLSALMFAWPLATYCRWPVAVVGGYSNVIEKCSDKCGWIKELIICKMLGRTTVNLYSNTISHVYVACRRPWFSISLPLQGFIRQQSFPRIHVGIQNTALPVNKHSKLQKQSRSPPIIAHLHVHV